MQALYLYEASLCPCGCGYPVAQSTDPRFKERFSVAKQVCYARAAIDEFDRGPEGKGRKPEPGEMRWADADLDWGRRLHVLAKR